MSYPYPPLSFDPYASQGNGDPYGPQNMPDRMSMPDDEETPNVPYMMDQMDGSPYGANAEAYAEGGRVGDNVPLSPLAQMLQEQGQHGDTILAHINPLEAMMLKSMGGSGTINPRTGLPQYFFGKIGNVFKKVLGPMGGAILGNMILPGAGALIGGGIGGMFGHPNQRMGPLAGAGVGAFVPMAIDGLGGLMSGAGATGMGGVLSSLAGQTANPLTSFLMPNMVSGGGIASPFSLSSLIGGGNAALAGQTANPLTSFLMPNMVSGGGIASPFSLSSLIGGGNAASTPFSMNPVAQLSSTLAPQSTGSSPGFLASLLGGAGAKGATLGAQTGSFLGQFLQPQNALSAFMVGNSLLNPPPSVEKQYKAQYMAQANAQKYLEDQLNEPERVRQKARLDRKVEQEKWEPLAESADDFETEQVSPEEYERSGKWFRKYKKDKQGQRVEVPYARGGEVAGYVGGDTGGQDDRIPAWLSDGEYVMDANTVSALGDGNNAAGAKRLDEFRQKLLHHKGMKGFPPKTKSLSSYLH